MTEASFRILREHNGLNIDETADLLGVSAKTVRRWEAGEIEPRRAFFEVLKGRLERASAARPSRSDFTFIDLFAGCFFKSVMTYA